MAAVERVLDEGGNSLDFNVLSPEEYLTAAIDAPLDALPEVGRQIVVDPPMPWTDPGALLEAIDSYAPRRRMRQRPPEPPDADEPDPIAVLRHQHAADLKRRRLAAENSLQGADEVELTSQFSLAGWPGAARILADLLVLHSSRGQPFAPDVGEMPLIDPEAAVTYLHPVRLRRLDRLRVPDSTGSGQGDWHEQRARDLPDSVRPGPVSVRQDIRTVTLRTRRGPLQELLLNIMYIIGV